MVEPGRLPGPAKTYGLRLRPVDWAPDKQLHVVAVRHLRDCGYFSCAIAVERVVLAYGAGAVDAFGFHGVSGSVALIAQLVNVVRQTALLVGEQIIEASYAHRYRFHRRSLVLEEVPVGFGMVPPAFPQCDTHGCESDERADYGDPILKRDTIHIQIFPHKKNAAAATAAVTRESR